MLTSDILTQFLYCVTQTLPPPSELHLDLALCVQDPDNHWWVFDHGTWELSGTVNTAGMFSATANGWKVYCHPEDIMHVNDLATDLASKLQEDMKVSSSDDTLLREIAMNLGFAMKFNLAITPYGSAISYGYNAEGKWLKIPDPILAHEYDFTVGSGGFTIYSRKGFMCDAKAIVKSFLDFYNGRAGNE